MIGLPSSGAERGMGGRLAEGKSHGPELRARRDGVLAMSSDAGARRASGFQDSAGEDENLELARPGRGRCEARQRLQPPP